MAPKGKKVASPIKLGSIVSFTGYADDVPDEERFLEAGGEYPVIELPGGDGDEAHQYIVQVANPNFNPKKKVNEDTNPETLEIEVFEEEIEYVGEPESEEEEGEEEAGEEEEEADTDGEEGDVTYEEVAALDKAGLLAFAKDNEFKPTVAQKKTAETLLAAIAEEFGLAPADEEEAEEEQEEEAEEEAPAPKKGKAAAKEKAAPAKAATKEKAPAKGKAETKPAKGKAAAKVEPKEEVSDELPDLEGEDESVLALIADDADLIQVAQDLESEISSNEYRLGGVLYHIHKEKAYLAVEGGEKYDEKGGFQLFLLDFFNVEYRKAMYLIEIYVAFTQAGIENPAEVVATMGWTKAQKIAKPLIGENADSEQLIELANSNTVADLSTIIKEEYTEGGTAGEKGATKTRVTLRFRLLEEEGNLVEDVLTVAAEQLGCKPEEALFQICADWASENSVKVSKRTGSKETTKEEKAPAKTAAKASAKPAAKPQVAPAKAPAKAAAKPAAKAAAKPAAKVAAKATGRK